MQPWLSKSLMKRSDIHSQEETNVRVRNSIPWQLISCWLKRMSSLRIRRKNREEIIMVAMWSLSSRWSECSPTGATPPCTRTAMRKDSTTGPLFATLATCPIVWELELGLTPYLSRETCNKIWIIWMIALFYQLNKTIWPVLLIFWYFALFLICIFFLG